jgi:hypothetical protein
MHIAMDMRTYLPYATLVFRFSEFKSKSPAGCTPLLCPSLLSHAGRNIPSPRLLHTCRYLSFAFRTAASIMKSNSVASSKKAQTYSAARRHSRSLHWLFRSNIPRRRNSSLPVDIRKRNFFGMGEIMQVLANVGLSAVFCSPSHSQICIILSSPRKRFAL